MRITANISRFPGSLKIGIRTATRLLFKNDLFFQAKIRVCLNDQDSFFNIVTFSGNMPAWRLSFSHLTCWKTRAMGKNHLKFVSIPEAVTEIKNTLLMQSELKKRQEIEPLLRRVENLQIPAKDRPI